MVRKADVELLEVRLEPLQTARDRHNEAINATTRQLAELTERVKDIERNQTANTLAIEQGLASIRSLLQRANRAAREQRMIEPDDDELDTDPTETNIPAVSPVRPRTHGGRRVI